MTKEGGMTMQFSVTGKQMDVGQALSQHIEASVTNLVGKYFGTAIEAHAVLSREGGHLYCCDLSVHIGRGILMQASETDGNPYQASDKAADRIAKRMRRYKRRLRDHHNGLEHKFQEALQAQYAIIAPEPDEHDEPGVAPGGDQPMVIAEMTTEIPTLTVGEAVMRMDLADTPTMMFRNSAHGGLNVVYRRKDGHIGWIDPREGQSERAGQA
jgi:ribosomal subunit interface protein